MELKEVFEPVLNFVKNFQKKEKEPASKQAAKDRLKLVLMQDRASVSPDFFDMMKKELIDVIKKYIEIDEESLEVELTRGLEVGLEGPALYANIPIKNVKPVAPQGEEIDEISEEKIDAAAEEILNQIEKVAQQNKEELAKQVVPEDEETVENVEESAVEVIETTEEVAKEASDFPVQNEEIVTTTETEEIEKTPVEEVETVEDENVEEKPKTAVRKRTTARKITKKKKEA